MTKFELYAFEMRFLASDAVADPTAGEAVVGDWGADMMLEMVSVAEEQSATDLSLLIRYLSYICVAVLARTLTRPASMCAIVGVIVGFVI